MPKGVYEHKPLGPRSAEVKAKISKAHKGRKASPETKALFSAMRKGKSLPKWSEESRRKLSELKSGSTNKWWKGGITPEYRRIRNSWQYKQFRRSVLERDGGKCVLCEATDRLCVDHIKPFSLYPELRTEVSNGRTLCSPCHIKTKTFGRNVPSEFCRQCPHCTA